MRKLSLLSILLSISSILFAKEKLDELVAHDGRWFLHSERIEEQSVDGDYVAKETFFGKKDISMLSFAANGICSITDSQNHKAAFRWKMIDQKTMELYDAKLDEKYVLEIIKITDDQLVLRYYEDLGDIKVAKLTTYCFPDVRLSNEEVRVKNQKDIFDIEGFTLAQ